MIHSDGAISYIGGNNQCIIILHEIYGMNDFIESTAIFYYSNGFDVICPDMNRGETFAYDEIEDAYHCFYQHSKDSYEKVLDMVRKWIPFYQKVFVLGFSAGATFAWRLAAEADGIAGTIACYGSRIRDYTFLKPKSNVLCIFAFYDSFDVEAVTNVIEKIPLVTVETFNARHGFMDSDNTNYHKKLSDRAFQTISEYIKKQ